MKIVELIRCLLHIFTAYGEVFGQVINKQKCMLYSGAISNSRLLMITNLLGFGSGSSSTQPNLRKLVTSKHN
jgi:hypothetical protein